MKKSILITGASSGIGKATAIYFAEKGWDVCATMRNPDKAKDLLKYPNIQVLALDVTDEESVKDGVATALKSLGKIDVLLNNAGYGLVGAFEAMSQAQIEQQFATNLFGVMNMTRAILPHFRAQKDGMIVNISSLGGLISFPLNSIYLSTKWALEGFMESLQYELKPFNIQIKNIEPGVIKTAFGDAVEFVSNKYYDGYAKAAQANMSESMKNAEEPIMVAKKVWEVVQDKSQKLRYVTGKGAKFLFLMRRLLPHTVFTKMVASQIEKGAK
ncbi:SDR family oxidoreductase [Pelobium sp.]|nr:SDR family oxidoreductase [Pelobium sp.]MDA9555379.1 SDR family oxidoreductase [Pelobium sp.]